MDARRLRARAAAYWLHAKRDSKELTTAAREAFLARFERLVDPDQMLPDAERARRATSARRAYFTQLALKSARRRSAKARKIS
jgi:hypothetical protein